MRHVILVALIMAFLLALPAMAQVERDPDSRHSSGSTVSPFMPGIDTPAPKPVAAPNPSAKLVQAARIAGRSISGAAHLLPNIELANLAQSAALAAAEAAIEAGEPQEAPEPTEPLPAPELDVIAEAEAPATKAEHPIAVETSESISDDPPIGNEPLELEEEPILTDEPAPVASAPTSPDEQYPPVRPLRDKPKPEVEPTAPEAAPEPAEEPSEVPEDMDLAADEQPDAETAPVGDSPEPEVQANPDPEPERQTQRYSGKRLVPDRRRTVDESLLGRDGSTDSVRRSQPKSLPESEVTKPDPPAPSAKLPEPEEPTPTEGSTSLAELTGSTNPMPHVGGEPNTLVQLNTMTPSTGLAAADTSSTKPSAAFIAPYPGSSAPVELALPSGLPQMPHYDVPAGMDVITRGNPAKKLVALTFDDGPHPEYTSQLLAVLDYYSVPATFFCVGVQVEKHPQWVKMMSQQGHEVANHTYDHFRLPKLPKTEKEYQIDEYQRLIESLTGVTPRFLRPPGGQDDQETGRMLSQRRMVMAMWDVAINDTSHGKLEQELLNVSLKKVRPGSVLLAHDGVQATIDMLPELIESLRAQGYEFVTLSELAAN